MTYPLTDKNGILDGVNYLLGNLEPIGNTYSALNKNDVAYFTFATTPINSYTNSQYIYPGTFANATCSVVSSTIVSVILNDYSATKIVLPGMTGSITISGSVISFRVLFANKQNIIIELGQMINGLTTFTSNLTITQFVPNKLYSTDLSSTITVDNSVVSLSAYIYGNVVSSSPVSFTMYINRYVINKIDATLFYEDFTINNTSFKFDCPNIIDAPTNGEYRYVMEFGSTTNGSGLTGFSSSKRGMNILNNRL